MKKVIILRGLPGCGKSRYANELKAENDPCIVCSTDKYFLVPTGNLYAGRHITEYKFDPFKLPEYHQKNMNFFIGTMRHGCPLIVVDNTNIHRWEYANYEEAALLAGYEVEIVEFRAITIEDVKVCIKRNTHKVPQDIIAKLAVEFEQDDRAVVKPIGR